MGRESELRVHVRNQSGVLNANWIGKDFDQGSRRQITYLRANFPLSSVCGFWKVAHVCAHVTPWQTHKNWIEA